MKVKELGTRLEDGERAKRHKIKKMRKQMEKELSSLKQRNTELFESSKRIEQELDHAMKRIDEQKEEILGLQDEKEMHANQICSLNDLNGKQEQMILYL